MRNNFFTLPVTDTMLTSLSRDAGAFDASVVAVLGGDNELARAGRGVERVHDHEASLMKAKGGARPGGQRVAGTEAQLLSSGGYSQARSGRGGAACLNCTVCCVLPSVEVLPRAVVDRGCFGRL